MKPPLRIIRYRWLKWCAGRKYPKYKFEKDKTGYLIYKRRLHPIIRRLLNLVRDILGWIIEKRDENDEVNREILDSLGLDPDTDIFSLDAFYKREFRKKKYIYFFTYRKTQNLPEPSNFLFEYMPKKESKDRGDFLQTPIKKMPKKA